MNTGFLGPAVATVPTVYGIETCPKLVKLMVLLYWMVATVPTVYGIETTLHVYFQHQPNQLQQYLPFTVLKLDSINYIFKGRQVATVPTVYGIETNH